MNNFGRIMREVSNGALDVKSIDKLFEEKVKVKLSDDWATSNQAATAESMPGSDHWAQSKQVETPDSDSGSESNWSHVNSSWGGLSTS